MRRLNKEVQMQERSVFIQTPDGKMEVFISMPEGKGPFPGVVIFQNVGGFSEILKNMARRATEEGYYCAVPDLYYRLGRVVIDPDSTDPDVMKVRQAASGSIKNGNIVKDAGALVEFMQNDPMVKHGGLGNIGYCMGGRFSVIAAEHFPDVFKASASLFGTRLITDAPDSPHLLLDRIKGELYCGFAEHDHSMPLDMVAKWDQMLKEAGVNFVSEVHPGTEHGYAFPGRKVYHKEASEKSWQRIFAMFKRQL